MNIQINNVTFTNTDYLVRLRNKLEKEFLFYYKQHNTRTHLKRKLELLNWLILNAKVNTTQNMINKLKSKWCYGKVKEAYLLNFLCELEDKIMKGGNE
jgi:hypothetical protein